VKKGKSRKEDPRIQPLRELLNEWNPIGVQGLPPDEYDSIIEPLLRRLARGCNEEFIVKFLDDRVGNDFGLSGEFGKKAFAAKVCAWYRGASS
jgi:hypothetical protein